MYKNDTIGVNNFEYPHTRWCLLFSTVKILKVLTQIHSQVAGSSSIFVRNSWQWDEVDPSPRRKSDAFPKSTFFRIRGAYPNLRQSSPKTWPLFCTKRPIFQNRGCLFCSFEISPPSTLYEKSRSLHCHVGVAEALKLQKRRLVLKKQSFSNTLTPPFSHTNKNECQQKRPQDMVRAPNLPTEALPKISELAQTKHVKCTSSSISLSPIQKRSVVE